MTFTTRQLEFEVDSSIHDHGGRSQHVTVTGLYNFGYAGRDQGAVATHVEELVDLGLPAPTTVPALFPLPPIQAFTDSEVVVSGGDTYGEVEYALVLTTDGWLVTVASDHSDFGIERLSTARSKAVAPDVLAPVAWRLDDVQEHWDQLEMWCTRADAHGATEVQRGFLAELLTPADLIAILERRLGAPLEVGTVILSGTLAGEPQPGASRWSVTLRNTVTGAHITHAYDVQALPDELVDRDPVTH